MPEYEIYHLEAARDKAIREAKFWHEVSIIAFTIAGASMLINLCLLGALR